MQYGRVMDGMAYRDFDIHVKKIIMECVRTRDILCLTPLIMDFGFDPKFLLMCVQKCLASKL